MELMTKCKINPINILAVIDTAYILSNYQPDQAQDPDNPLLINDQAAHMICTNARGTVGGEGSTNLAFQARKGDYVFFRGLSMTANAEDATIIYNVLEEDHHHIFGAFSGDEESIQAAAEPDPEYTNGIPATSRPADFLSIRSKVKKAGTATLHIQFGLYMLDHDQETQSLYGYFQWKAKIKIEAAPN